MSVGSIVRVHLNGVGGRRRVYHVTWQKLWFGTHVIYQRKQIIINRSSIIISGIKAKIGVKNVPIKHEIIMTFFKKYYLDVNFEQFACATGSE